MLDLSAFDSLAESQELGIDVEIKGPDRKTPLGLTIRVAGPDSQRQKDACRHLADARLSAEDAAPVTSRDIERNMLFVLAKATIAWTPNVAVDGKELECTEDNARTVYQRYPWIFEQVKYKAENRAAFSKGSVSPSAAP